MWILIASKIGIFVISVSVLVLIDKKKGYVWQRPLWKQLSCDGALFMLGAAAMLISHRAGWAIGMIFVFVGSMIVTYMRKDLGVKRDVLRNLSIFFLGLSIGFGL